MLDVVIQVEGLSKQYRLGEVSTGSLHHDVNRWWHKVRGLPDPYLSVTGTNIRTGKVEKNNSHNSNNSRLNDYVWALQDINFEVRRGEVLGVIGQNGAGKSTLLKIMSRITAPTIGEVRVKGRIASLLEVGTGFHPELTGRENIFLNGAILGMTKPEIAFKLDEIVDFSGCARYLDTPVKRYSSGMIVRLGFAVAAHLDPEILIVDEVLAVGDLEFQKRCLRKMKDVAGHGRTVLFVSHNMAAVRNLCARVIWIDQGRIRMNGDVSVLEEYERFGLTSVEAEISLPEGCLFQTEPNEAEGKSVEITCVEMLDDRGQARRLLSTWDTVCFRIHGVAHEAVQRAGVELYIRSVSGERLIACFTQPERNVEVTLDKGAFCIDCCFPKFPLSAGEFVLGVGVSLPMVSYLYQNENLCVFEVKPKDVFQSGYPYMERRSLMVPEHHWAVPHTEHVPRA